MHTRLEPTGERMIEDAYHHTKGSYVIYLMHAASYAFAESYCKNKRVLDLGCGSGYGVAKIASVASTVHAVDVSSDAIAYAREHYGRDNITFSTVDADASLPFPADSFDVVLSFQVLEHVVDERNYLQEASRVLGKNGLLILITPDRNHRLLPYQKPWNRWHLREYAMQDLCNLVSVFFVIERSLKMGMKADVAQIELKRYRLLKWLTLPFTLPVFPEFFRQWGLNLLHKIKGQEKITHAEKFTPTFGIEAVNFSEQVEASLNLLILARVEK